MRSPKRSRHQRSETAPWAPQHTADRSVPHETGPQFSASRLDSLRGLWEGDAVSAVEEHRLEAVRHLRAHDSSASELETVHLIKM